MFFLGEGKLLMNTQEAVEKARSWAAVEMLMYLMIIRDQVFKEVSALINSRFADAEYYREATKNSNYHNLLWMMDSQDSEEQKLDLRIQKNIVDLLIASETTDVKSITDDYKTSLDLSFKYYKRLPMQHQGSTKFRKFLRTNRDVFLESLFKYKSVKICHHARKLLININRRDILYKYDESSPTNRKSMDSDTYERLIDKEYLFGKKYKAAYMDFMDYLVNIQGGMSKSGANEYIHQTLEKKRKAKEQEQKNGESDTDHWAEYRRISAEEDEIFRTKVTLFESISKDLEAKGNRETAKFLRKAIDRIAIEGINNISKADLKYFLTSEKDEDRIELMMTFFEKLIRYIRNFDKKIQSLYFTILSESESAEEIDMVAGVIDETISISSADSDSIVVFYHIK